jgi:hypothetical protein
VGRGRRTGVGLTSARILGAALVGANAWIHLDLYREGYRVLHVIGPLFALNAGLGLAIALALLGVPRRVLPWTALAGALFEFGTLAALLLSSTVGLFGFTETLSAHLAPASIAVESLGGVVLLALAVVA